MKREDEKNRMTEKIRKAGNEMSKRKSCREVTWEEVKWCRKKNKK